MALQRCEMVLLEAEEDKVIEWTASWNGHVDVARVPLDTEMRKEVMIGLSKASAIDRI